MTAEDSGRCEMSGRGHTVGDGRLGRFSGSANLAVSVVLVALLISYLLLVVVPYAINGVRALSTDTLTDPLGGWPFIDGRYLWGVLRLCAFGFVMLAVPVELVLITVGALYSCVEHRRLGGLDLLVGGFGSLLAVGTLAWMVSPLGTVLTASIN